MEGGRCNVVYYDGIAGRDFVVDDTNIAELDTICSAHLHGGQNHPQRSPQELTANIRALSTYFGKIHICITKEACLKKVLELDQSNFEDAPTVVLIAVPSDDENKPNTTGRDDRSPSPMSSAQPDLAKSETKTVALLREFANRTETENVSAAILPVIVLHVSAFEILSEVSGVTEEVRGRLARRYANDARPVHPEEYLDAGAYDILPGPLTHDRAHGLRTLAYRAQKDFAKRGLLQTKPQRRTSWVGVAEEKPFAYLREAMVSRLMDSICDPNQASIPVEPVELRINESQYDRITSTLGMWTFSAHDFTDDELLFGALLILEHALASPELEKWQMRRDRLAAFLTATKRVYNSFVLYHNFRHACDVLQAIFVILIKIGSLPPYPSRPSTSSQPASPLAALLHPFHVLTLLISAIGHDVGHPGVNNLFLITLNAPLAQLYNDRSVLESFHCAAYSQILRRYWPAAFSDLAMRKLMINTILATDMGVHAQYMLQLSKLSEVVTKQGQALEGISQAQREEYRELICCLLIKCADICNVARQYTVATRWAYILTEEFQNQSMMEEELHMPTCLFGGPPVRDDVLKMGSSQIGFMNIFAAPLFSGVSNVLPGMSFTTDVITSNRRIWEEKMEKEKQIRGATVPPSALPLASSASLPIGPTQDTAPAVLVRENRTSEPLLPVTTAVQTTSRHSPSSPSSRKSSSPSSRKSSGGIATHFSGLPINLDQSRRSSLGNSTNAPALDNASRRSSGGYSHMPTQPQHFRSSPVIANQLLQQFDGTPGPRPNVGTNEAGGLNLRQTTSPKMSSGSLALPQSMRPSNSLQAALPADAAFTSTRLPRSRSPVDAWSIERPSETGKQVCSTEIASAEAEKDISGSRGKSRLAALRFWKKTSRGGSRHESL